MTPVVIGLFAVMTAVGTFFNLIYGEFGSAFMLGLVTFFLVALAKNCDD